MGLFVEWDSFIVEGNFVLNCWLPAHSSVILSVIQASNLKVVHYICWMCGVWNNRQRKLVLIEKCFKLIYLCDTHMQTRYPVSSHATNAIRWCYLSRTCCSARVLHSAEHAPLILRPPIDPRHKRTGGWDQTLTGHTAGFSHSEEMSNLFYHVAARLWDTIIANET